MGTTPGGQKSWERHEIPYPGGMSKDASKEAEVRLWPSPYSLSKTNHW